MKDVEPFYIKKQQLLTDIQTKVGELETLMEALSHLEHEERPPSRDCSEFYYLGDALFGLRDLSRAIERGAKAVAKHVPPTLIGSDHADRH